MANHFTFFAGAAFPYEDTTFYNGFDDGLVDSNMTYVDPNLQCPSPTPYTSSWDAPVQRFLKDTQKTSFFVANIPSQPDHAPLRPTVGIPPVPPPSQARFASPISSVEPSSSAGARSPPADTESYYDNFPRTPPDSALLSPFQAPLPLEPYSNAHAVQFTNMGPDYVNPFDVNPSQQSEYGESDNSIVDFDFTQPGCAFDDHSTSQRAADPAHDTAIADGIVKPMAAPDQGRPMLEDQIKASSQYPPVPMDDEGINSDDEVTPNQQHGDGDDDGDGDYRPNKRQKTSTRASARRRTKSNSTPASQQPRRRRARTPYTSAAASSSNDTKSPLTCPDCNDRDFPSRADLDAHVKKQHMRPFNCVFDFAGCDSTFPSKNEWKRHVNTQHLLLHYWVCTEGTCSSTTDGEGTTGSIFNRKDLFTQHLKRMHTPQEVKDHQLDNKKRPSPASRGRDSTTSANPNPTPSAVIVAQWEARLRALQTAACRPRCSLPTIMHCPVPDCGASAFRGHDAWNQRMEHVAKHMERAAQGRESSVVFGGEADQGLVEWASRRDVGIIVPAPVPASAGGGDDGKGVWVLENPLKRGPGGTSSVAVSAPGGGSGGAGNEKGEGGEEEEVKREIVVSRDAEWEGEEEDAEGEEDD